MIASSRPLLATTLAFAFAFVATRARAEPPTESQIEAARALYKEARELHRQGKLKEAIELALDAYRTAATPVTALEAGTLLVEAGRLVEARDLLRAVAPLPLSHRESDKGREARQGAASLAASLDARIPKLALSHQPRGADVIFDGKLLPPSDANAWQGVDPGPHRIVVRVGERTCSTITATLVEGEERTIELHDAAKACAPEPRPVTPLPREAPLVSAPPAVTPPVDTTRARARLIGAVVEGIGLVALGGGVIVALGAKADYDSVATSCPPRGCSHAAFDTREAARSRADAATVMLVAGSAASVLGAVFIFWPSSTGEARADVALTPAGARLHAAF